MSSRTTRNHFGGEGAQCSLIQTNVRVCINLKSVIVSLCARPIASIYRRSLLMRSNHSTSDFAKTSYFVASVEKKNSNNNKKNYKYYRYNTRLAYNIIYKWKRRGEGWWGGRKGNTDESPPDKSLQLFIVPRAHCSTLHITVRSFPLLTDLDLYPSTPSSSTRHHHHHRVHHHPIINPSVVMHNGNPTV